MVNPDYREVLRELRALGRSREVTSEDWQAWEQEMHEIDVPQDAILYMEGERHG